MSLSYNTIAIFAGSGPDLYHLSYEAQRLGHELGRRSIDLVCNGSGKGLSEEFFSAARSEGGPIVKLVAPELAKKIPTFMTNTTVVPMKCPKERKREMIQRADAIIVLPGGLVGEESDSVLTPKDLANGAGEKPLILLNLDKHFNKLGNAIAAHGKTENIQWARCIDEALDMFDFMRVHPQPRASV